MKYHFVLRLSFYSRLVTKILRASRETQARKFPLQFSATINKISQRFRNSVVMPEMRRICGIIVSVRKHSLRY